MAQSQGMRVVITDADVDLLAQVHRHFEALIWSEEICR